MSTELVKISPECLEVANTYLQTMSIAETSRSLCMPVDEVTAYLDKKEIKRYIDAVFMEQGYMNRHTLQSVLTSIITAKLEECEESEIYTQKDLADLLMMAHKMRMDELKLQQENNKTEVKTQVNVQNNYSALLDRIMSPVK